MVTLIELRETVLIFSFPNSVACGNQSTKPDLSAFLTDDSIGDFFCQLTVRGSKYRLLRGKT